MKAELSCGADCCVLLAAHEYQQVISTHLAAVRTVVGEAVQPAAITVILLDDADLEVVVRIDDGFHDNEKPLVLGLIFTKLESPVTDLLAGGALEEVEVAAIGHEEIKFDLGIARLEDFVAFAEDGADPVADV